jgi:predicted nucleotidyltransferase
MERVWINGESMNKADQDKIINICRRNDISMVGIFGSTARDDATESSDIDLFVKLSKPKSLLSLVRLERNISEALGKKVDLLTEGAISPYLKDRILKELTVIYEA